MEDRYIKVQVEEFVYKRLANEGSGHDWWHIDRVRKTALKIGEKENANMLVVELAALLHDLIDEKLPDKVRVNVIDIERFLIELGLELEIIQEIIYIIQVISFRKNIQESQLTLEGKVVQDADRLDAIGAIGIARTFTYAGSKGNLIYHPDENERSDAISHFYDKLLKLKDLMKTSTGRILAEERHRFLQLFLVQFYNEWKGLK